MQDPEGPPPICEVCGDEKVLKSTFLLQVHENESRTWIWWCDCDGHRAEIPLMRLRAVRNLSATHKDDEGSPFMDDIMKAIEDGRE